MSSRRPAAPVPPRPTPARVAAAVVRRTQPLLVLWLYGGTEAYLLLTLFDLCLGLAAIPMAALVRTFAGTADDSLVATVDQRLTAWALVGGLGACFVVPFGMPLVMLGATANVAWGATFALPGFWLSAAVVLALAGREIALVAPERDRDAMTALRDPAAHHAVGRQMALLMGFYVLALLLAGAGRVGLVALPVAFAGLEVLHDLRPDLLARVWRR